MKVGDPASIPAHKDVSLLVKAGGFGPLEHHPLVEDLHGVDPLRVPQLDDAHLAESPATNHFDQLEIVARQSQALDLAHARFHCAK